MTSGGVPITTSSPETVSVSEAAQRLGLCVDSVYRALKRGELPMIQIGHRHLIPRAPFERMLQGEGADGRK